MEFVGRKIETSILDEQLSKIVSAFIVIYGRRRIGKTYFVRDYCERNEIVLLEFTGLFQQNTKKQLEHFIDRINELGLENEFAVPESWTKAFGVLNRFIDKHFSDKKVIIFLDEAPWMDSGKSDFIAAIGDLWDNRIKNDPRKNLVVCGSAASYMLNKIIGNQGPLHNRPTSTIEMQQFNLDLSKQMVKLHNWYIQERSICDVYISIGGVAKYISDLNKTVTPEQAIQEACFNRNGQLNKEYQDLFHSLFKKAKTHYKIMDALSQTWQGLSRSEITKSIEASASTVSKVINELISSGFIEERKEFQNRKKGERLLVSDMFCYFHYKWIKPNKVKDWTSTSRTQSYRSWAGFAFERICQLHTYQIKKKLGIHGVSTETHYWQSKDKEAGGAQIDMLLEHTNGSKNIDIIECKYYDGEFIIDRNYYNQLLQKRSVFDRETGYKYNIRLVLITTEGVKKNQYSNGLNLMEVTLSDLFSPEP